MQVFLYAMPAIAVYMALSTRAEVSRAADLWVLGTASLAPSLYAVALLCGLLVCLWKWRQHRTTRWRHLILSCVLVSCFVGSRYLVPATRVAESVYTQLLIG